MRRWRARRRRSPTSRWWNRLARSPAGARRCRRSSARSRGCAGSGPPPPGAGAGLGREISWLRWLGPLSAERRLVIGLGVLAALLFLPWLGATGFWDPWEPHYGEVAREMIARGDYIHPWWESSWFFSKPALDLWLMAAGMLVAGTNGAQRYVGVFTEWCVRLPYAAIVAAGAVLLFIMANRLLTRRSAVIGTIAVLTSPLFVLLAR